MWPRHPNESGQPPVIRSVAWCVISTLALAAATQAASIPAPNALRARIAHGDDHEGGLIPSMHDLGHEASSGASEALTSGISSASVASTPSASAVPPPNPHSHGSHSAPLEVLDDAGIHFWHHFPPTYLAADFRLDNDSAIFGEEFDETWDPKKASGHRTLAFTHAFVFYAAYFGFLPVGKFNEREPRQDHR